MAKKYVMHFCKKNKCNNGWIDLDLTNSVTYPPKWKYCKECCKKYGHVNNFEKVKRVFTEKQLQVQKKFLNVRRKKVIKPC